MPYMSWFTWCSGDHVLLGPYPDLLHSTQLVLHLSLCLFVCLSVCLRSVSLSKGRKGFLESRGFPMLGSLQGGSLIISNSCPNSVVPRERHFPASLVSGSKISSLSTNEVIHLFSQEFVSLNTKVKSNKFNFTGILQITPAEHAGTNYWLILEEPTDRCHGDLLSFYRCEY